MAKVINFIAATFVAAILCGCGHYVPRPHPVHSDIEISAFYYPGTEQMEEWDMVDQTYPGIKPLLGWYDEGNPEVIDWQIKWAVEHGISSFAVDWYWNQGVQRLDHWVKGFYQAKWRSYLKWFIMWANHNEPGAHSTADQLAVTQFWIDNYFKTPEYYRIDDRPVVIVWEFNNLDRDFIAEAAAHGEVLQAGEGVRKALALSDSLARASGLKGIYFIDMLHGSSMRSLESGAGRIEAAGYEAQTIYGFDFAAFKFVPGHDVEYDSIGRREMTYDFLCEGVNRWWECVDSVSTHPFWPIIPTGWDDTPRSFERARRVLGRTPEKFHQVCLDAKAFCERTGNRHVIIAPLNEWQEGSYIEPNQEFGFAMYDALRDAFCTKPAQGWPENISPADVGLGPYDYPEIKRQDRTSWDFNDGVQGWYRNPYGTTIIKSIDGSLHFFRTNHYLPAIRTRIQAFDAGQHQHLKIRMKVSPNKAWKSNPTGEERLTVWFSTDSRHIISPDFSLDRDLTLSCPVMIDGQWHEYDFDMSMNPLWQGKVDELWLDPANLQYAIVDIDSISF